MTHVARCSVCQAEMMYGRCPTCSDSLTTVGEGAGTGESDATPLFDELAEALAPHLLLIQLVGQGGMGLVYLARDPALKRPVAVKVLSPRLARDDTARARFAREAETMAGLSHPHIVGVHQVGRLPRSGTSYFVMQYIDGVSLKEQFPRGHPVAESKARRCIGEVASALAAAHRLGVVHRDVKPANVMVDRETGRYLVLDFGISSVVPPPTGDLGGVEDLTSENMRVGTPFYMSPEQAAGERVTGKSDVYSLGCVAYQLLTGELPFGGETPMAVLAAHLLQEPPKIRIGRPELDSQFADLIDRCLAKSPQARPTADEVARALLPSSTSVIEWPPPGLEPVRGFGGQWTKTAALVALTAAMFFLALMMQPSVSRTCCWRSPETSRLWETLKHLSYVTPIHFDDPDAMSVWYFLLDGIFILLLFGIARLAVRTWQFTQRLRPGLRAGYPWKTLLDVAWDEGPDTSDLLNGTGVYSLASSEDRRRLLSRRRLRSALLVTALLLGIVAPVLWLYLGAHIYWPDRAPVVGIADAVGLWFLPALALAASPLANVVRLPALTESRRHGQAWIKVPPVRVIRTELVAVWLRSASIAAPARRWPFSVWALPAGTALLLIALIVAMVIVLSVVFKSTARMVSSADDARVWIEEASAGTGGRVDPPSPRAALALIADPAMRHQPDLARLIEASAASPRLESAEPAGYCLSPRRVLFGPTIPPRSFTSSDQSRGVRLAASARDALALVGLAGLAHRSSYCSSVLGSEVSTVDQVR